MLGHPVDKKLAQKLSVNNSAFKLKKVNSMLRLIHNIKTFWKRHFQYKCFPVNSAKFWEYPFCRRPLDDCFCKIASSYLAKKRISIAGDRVIQPNLPGYPILKIILLQLSAFWGSKNLLQGIMLWKIILT